MLKHAIFILTMMLFVSGCGSDNNDGITQELSIASSKQVCFGMIQALCKQTTDLNIGENSQPSLMLSSIEGFEYRWGYTTVVRIRRTEIDNPPADGSSFRYLLLNVISDTEDEIGTEYFYERVGIFENTFTESEGQYQFLGNDIECQPALCDDLVVMGMGAEVNVTLAYLGNGILALTDWN